VFNKNLTSKLIEIKLTENGFSINEPFGAKPKIFDWKDIKNIKFSENNNVVIIEKIDEQVILKNNYTGWYELIQNIPTEFTNFDFDYAKTFMDSLKPCDVCGIIAVRKTECIVCETIEWNNKMSESETEYLKRKQLDLYSVLKKDGREIKKQAEPEHGFKANENWKLYI
jgi:hypothetical protein